MLILYLPPDALEQPAAADANEPEGSGNTYQFRVVCRLELPPQAANANAATAAASPVRHARLQPEIRVPLSLLTPEATLPFWPEITNREFSGPAV